MQLTIGAASKEPRLFSLRGFLTIGRVIRLRLECVLRWKMRTIGTLATRICLRINGAWFVNLRFGLVVEDAAVIGFKVRVNITSGLSLPVISSRTFSLTHSHMKHVHSGLKNLRGDIHQFIRCHRW